MKDVKEKKKKSNFTVVHSDLDLDVFLHRKYGQGYLPTIHGPQS